MDSSTTKRPSARRRKFLFVGLAVLLTAIVLAVPGVAVAYTDPGGAPAHAGISTSPPPTTITTVDNGGFSWGDAAIGFGSALAVVAMMGGIVVVMRRRQRLASA